MPKCFLQSPLLFALLFVTPLYAQANSGTARNHEEAVKVGSAQSQQPSGLEVLSETNGVDLKPYLKGVFRSVKDNWYKRIKAVVPQPEQSKQGSTAIEFAIARDGAVAAMKLVASAGDVIQDRAAWEAITAAIPFPSLPAVYRGKTLLLRLRFLYNPGDRAGISVSISPSGEAQVALGETKAFTATVTGAEDKRVSWSVIGSGCSGAACGKVSGGSYVAPNVLPSPPVVTLMASSESDLDAYTSVTVRLIKP